MSKHIPERMCIACRKMYPKAALIKLVSKDGVIEFDIKSKKEGRGAYICKSSSCIRMAKKKKALSRHFKMPVGEEIYDKAEEYVDG